MRLKYKKLIISLMLCLNILSYTSVAYANSYVPTIDGTFSVFVDGVQEFWNSSQILEWVKGVQNGTWTKAVKFGDTVTDAVLSQTALNVAISSLGVLAINYEISQGLEWSDNYNKESTAILVGNNVIASYEALNNGARDNLATIIYNTLIDPFYYSSMGMPLSNALVNSWAPLIVNYVNPITLSTSVVSGNTIIPYSVMRLLTESQLQTINSWGTTNGYFSSPYYYITPFSASYTDSVLYATSTHKLYFYNSETGDYYTSITSPSGYRLQIGNALWTYAAGVTYNLANYTYNTIDEILEWYSGRIFVTDVPGNPVVGAEKTLEDDKEIVFPIPETAPKEVTAVPTEVDKTFALEAEATDPIQNNTPNYNWLNGATPDLPDYIENALLFIKECFHRIWLGYGDYIAVIIVPISLSIIGIVIGRGFSQFGKK